MLFNPINSTRYNNIAFCYFGPVAKDALAAAWHVLLHQVQQRATLEAFLATLGPRAAAGCWRGVSHVCVADLIL